MAAHPDDHHPIESRIGLPVAAAVEPMSDCLAAGGRDRAGPAQLGKGRFGADPIGLIAHKDQHLGGGAGGDPISRSQGRRTGGRECIQMSLMGLDLRALISASSVSQRCARARRAALAEAVGEVSAPARSAAKCRISAILPAMPSSCSRKLSGALTIRALRVIIAWVRLFTAVSRATLR